jgi:hypothetical protein
MKNILPFFLILTSCFTSRVSYTVPDFFVCNQWVDKNQNGIMEIPEFENVKNSFRSYEKITMVGVFHKPIGTNIGYKVYSPDGSVIEDGNTTQTYLDFCWQMSETARYFLSKGSPGLWKVEWYIEGILVNVTQFNIIQ